MGISVSWLFCVILTLAGAFPSDPSSTGYGGRTDTKLGVLKDANWFRFPYPGENASHFEHNVSV